MGPDQGVVMRVGPISPSESTFTGRRGAVSIVPRWPRRPEFSLPWKRPQRRKDNLIPGAPACLGYLQEAEGK